jgi:hydroxymethylglutaryl-CoA reductase
MAIEEPSVIAACSAIGKLISDKGTGFICESTPPVMIGQIDILDIVDMKDAENRLINEKQSIIEYANKACESMVKRGGGVENMRLKRLN